MIHLNQLTQLLEFLNSKIENAIILVDIHGESASEKNGNWSFFRW